MLAAKLIVKGEDLGPHTFFIQIRDIVTREPLDGIDVGDIGPKFGINGNDNGYLRFDHVRVPKDAMMNRFARITPDGLYELLDPNGIKILFQSLVSARVGIVMDSWLRYATSVTIATRYSLIREQFTDYEDPTRERQLLDYQIQRYKIFKNLARFYGHIFAKKPVCDHYFECEERLFKGDDSLLQEIHALSSLYKVYVSQTTVEGLEECRRSCGGHGYMMLSGMPSLYSNHVPTMTYDGDNNILALQAARYFVGLMRKPNPNGVFGFLSTPMNQLGSITDLREQQSHQACFEAIAKFKVNFIYQREVELLKQGVKKQVIWNEYLQVEGIEAAEAVYHASLHGYYIEGVNKSHSHTSRQALEYLRQIYATTELGKYRALLVKLGMNNESIDILKEVQLDSLDKTRCNALSLIEAVEVPEQTLNTVIGRKEANIYQNMIWSSKYMNPINKGKIYPGMTRYFKPKL